jgi:hypothetical protein
VGRAQGHSRSLHLAHLIDLVDAVAAAAMG